jgi:hypothetical protein
MAAELAARQALRRCAAARSLGGLLLEFASSVTSDALGMVPTGGELTLFEAVGQICGLTCSCLSLVAGRGCLA